MGLVLFVHSLKLEDEVCHAAEEENLAYISNHKTCSGNLRRGAYDDDRHAEFVLSSSEKCSHHEDKDSDRNGSNCQAKLWVLERELHYDKKLYSEPKEEEKIELQQGNVDLHARISFFFIYMSLVNGNLPGR